MKNDAINLITTASEYNREESYKKLHQLMENDEHFFGVQFDEVFSNPQYFKNLRLREDSYEIFLKMTNAIEEINSKINIEYADDLKREFGKQDDIDEFNQAIMRLVDAVKQLSVIDSFDDIRK